MAELATSDAVVNAYFDTDGVCDKMEASDHVSSYVKTRLAELDAKQAAGTAFTKRDIKFMVRALEQYLFNAI